mmetsp:Transcript_3596/g.6024  ORF Transcript_3596/g.6024 Transcript_3596/m.6024 type:complete len:250 (+) Transcript_3596:80-829(+)
MALRGVESLAFTTASQVTANRPSVPLPLSGAAQLNATSAPQTFSTAGALSAGAVAGVAAFALGSRSNRRTANVSRAAVATVGQKVTWKGNPGTVKYSGPVDFASGEWVGVQLDAPNGMHDGTVFNVPYFTCPPKTGIFCTPAEIGAGGAPTPAAPAAAPMAAAPVAAPAAVAAPAPAGGSFAVGSRVMWNGNAGTVQYVGEVGFATGEWVGVALDQPVGMHDGSLFNKTYFSCTAKHGVFSQASALQAA